MKGLTLTQPYATLIAVGAKTIETRSWSTTFRGLLAIHAGAGLGPVGGRRGLRSLVASTPFFTALVDTVAHTPERSFVDATVDSLPLGAIVAVARLADVQQITAAGLVAHGTTRPLPPEPERSFGDYTPGRFGWLLADVRRLTTPVPCKGALSLWALPPDVQAAVEAQL